MPALLRSHIPPLNLPPGSSSLCPIVLQRQIHNPFIYGSFASPKFRFRISCSNCSTNPVTVETPKKKKRKPRPSFIQQIRDKWSLKQVSLREKFPWQEEEEEYRQHHDEEEEEEEEERRDESVSFSNTDANPSVNDSVNFVLPDIVVSAPWTQGIRPKRTQFNSELEISRISDGGKDTVDGVRSSHCGEEDVSSDGTGTRAFVSKPKGKFEGTPIELSRDSRRASVFQGLYRVGASKNKLVGNYGECENSVVSKEATQVELSGEDEEMAVGGDLNNMGSSDEQQLVENGRFGNFEVSIDVNNGSVDLPWKVGERELEKQAEERRKRSNTELAEKIVPEHQLHRLRNVALRMLERIQVAGAGITEELVNVIHEKWKVDEVVKLKFEVPLSFNMKRTHEVLESRTGGLVIWRSGSSVVLYRGMAYKLPCVQSYVRQNQVDKNVSQHSKDTKVDILSNKALKDSVRSMTSFIPASTTNLKDLSNEELVRLTELNHLLDELGPRYKDWRGPEPFPVDADLLPALVRGYKPPFRLLPYGMQNCLRNKDVTMFRRLARRTPPHFVLGRNRELQGLANAMVKLWEKSVIAKIAIKHGVQDTRNERMAEELKQLTGGTLLSRNKDYIVFYRGNDFLPPVVTETLKERQKLTHLYQDMEEEARRMGSASVESNARTSKVPLVAGTLAETIAATSRWGHLPSNKNVEEMRRHSAWGKQASVIRKLEENLALAKGKFRKAEKALAKVQENLIPSELPTDLETISDEERSLFRKIGLSMKPYLPLGKRGVYDGTIQNMHLHWKYREVVKIIARGRSYPQVKHIAVSLEAESGGVLVSVERTPKGYAIIVYRGKNYQCPHALKPRNLLTKRQALARSIELQRHEALKHHIADLEKRIELLKSESEELKLGKEIGTERTLFSKSNDAFVSKDDIEE
ncbi:hypothetical protein HS088_TW04G00427 [Tripterygium wilfordii]|uniref:CRM domain-containing protein n=1 Tax=Tripterygium wilfordii TaxID=458696 RepID=A0A7J7DQA3_TRIWF|nr:CRM-domain containing factor CFM3, chloroplastic/mitochondrial [Tripterygium wilfordii]XP_038699773.1 CRM-domain containing factor CFM3, chloroplastic/mitochondrial [Tripterygium wilfordii]KAF5748473.1 hypothetical protein HS088_TW04G00427 [Tripterygium wilfordii]